MARSGRQHRTAWAAFAREKNYPVEDAIAFLLSHKRETFDETFEVALNLGVDTRHADQQVRGVVALPHGSGQSVRVAVFARADKAEAARSAGADIVGAEDLMEKIQSGFIEFDRCIATPDMMSLVGRLGKILGPRNLMPNPKLGTVTMDVAAAVESAKGGEVQFRAEKNGIVHAGIGKMSFNGEQLASNLRAFVKAIQTAKPSGSKGTYLKRAAISSSMGVGVKLDLSTL